MIHKQLFIAIGFLTFTACQKPKPAENQNIPKTEVKTEVKTEATSQPKPEIPKPTKTGEPEMSVGLPPDKEALETAKKEQQNTSNVIYFKEGENKFLKEYETNVTFKQITEDSRCPKDVNCIWAGVATAEVELMGLYTRPVTLKLSTINDANKNYRKTQVFNGFSVSLVELSPETTSDKGFKALKGSYKIGLKFSKENSENTNGTTTK
ncbi:hypothetical protein [Kaistella montana]|uniref:Lipoprotein n=1 Tax=Kaistella montana TaxID=1849733 RepID=A0ABW5K747_9FLAO|nr:hypothetical protein [Kaistella montana]MCQ4034199.1 hypothetical protein [Kaistella montana]